MAKSAPVSKRGRGEKRGVGEWKKVEGPGSRRGHRTRRLFIESREDKTTKHTSLSDETIRVEEKGTGLFLPLHKW